MKKFNQYLINSRDSISKISKKTGIEEEKLNAFNSQLIKPTFSDLRRLSSFFKTPVSYLIAKVEENDKYDFLYRKSFEQEISTSVKDKFTLFIDNIQEIGIEKSNIEQIRERIKPREDTYKNAEILAAQFRLEYLKDDQFSPLVNLPFILSEKLGFIVKTLEIGNNADGASAYIDSIVFLFISPRFEGRMLFTLAHELAHIINHQGDDNFFYLDKKISYNSKNIRNEQERFANAFASALLLPIKGIARMITKIRELNDVPSNDPIGDVEILFIARFFGVSFDVAAFRLESLRLIPEGGSYSLSMKLKKDFGSPEKRADSLNLPKRTKIDFNVLPSFFVKKVLSLINDGEYSIERMAEMLSIPINEIINYNSQFIENE